VEEKVFSLRSARRSVEAVPAPAPVVVADPLLEQRIAALEARTEEQEAMLRRVLILLVDWVENSQEPAYHRTHAA
jgi:general secretion pathway protein A